MSIDPSTEATEFKGEHIHAFMTRKPACCIELKVLVSSPLIEAARREATKSVGKKVALPGFRKGKSPEELIRKNFPMEIEKELHSKLADAAFAETQKIARIPILNNNATITFDLKSLNAEGAEIVFTFETEPNVPTIDPKLFHPKPVPRNEVGDKEIDEAIRQMQFFFAEWIPVSDRPIQEKDVIVINLDTIDGEEPQRVFNQVRFEVSTERMAEWMKKLVHGAKLGDVLEGVSEPDDQATPEEKQEFQPKKVRISILNVEQASLPELNDDFAKKVGAKDVDHMRQSVKEMLTRQADDHVYRQLREQVNDFLLEHYAFEVPYSLIKAEKDHRREQLLQNANFKKDWDKMTGNDRNALEEKITSESRHAVQLFYLSRQVVNGAKLGITHKEVQEEAISTLKSHGMHNIEVDQIPKDVYALAVSKVMLAKAQDFILREQKA